MQISPNHCESEQALMSVQARYLQCSMTSVKSVPAHFFIKWTSDHKRSELGIHDHSNEQSSSKLVPKVLSCLLKEQLLEPALNLTVHCCGLEFRVLNGYDQKSLPLRPRLELLCSNVIEH
ncbi:hypothetical protein Tco_0231355 [Tanacetum coccineum]